MKLSCSDSPSLLLSAASALFCLASAAQSPLSASFPHDNPLLSLHRSIVEIPSVTSTEENITTFLTSHLRALNYTVTLLPLSPSSNRANILVHPLSLPQPHHPQNLSTRILLTTHIDTVPPFIPYTYNSHYLNPTISGRGSVDAKAALAAQLRAVSSLLPTLKPGDLSLLFVPGEETIGDGMRSFDNLTHPSNLNLTYESVVFGEPTESRLANGHKGIHLFSLLAHGKAAHSGYPELGVSANHLLLKGLQKLESLTLPYSSKFGNSTLNIGKITGGVAANVVPAAARADCSIRLAGGTIAELKQLLKTAIAELDAGKGSLEIETILDGYSPVGLDTDVDGFDTITVNYGTDIPNLPSHKGKRYLYGPGSILVAHGPDEHISVKDLERAVGDYKSLILAALGKKTAASSTNVQAEI